VRGSPDEYLGLSLRAHEVMRGIPLYDVSVIDLPGGGAGRTIADIRRLDSATPPSRVATVLYGLRHLLGRVFGWDRVQVQPGESLLSRLSEQDRRDSEVAPGTPDDGFRLLYRLPHEQLSEIRNAVVRGYVCLALAATGTGYRLYFAVYVVPVSWITRPYLIVIEPFRRVLYPAMLGRIRRAWIAAYASSP
jgi:hypothetical protein